MERKKEKKKYKFKPLIKRAKQEQIQFNSYTTLLKVMRYYLVLLQRIVIQLQLTSSITCDVHMDELKIPCKNKNYL